MLVEAVGDDFHQARSLARARPVGGGLGRRVDLEHVLPVRDPDARHREAGGAVGDHAGGDGMGRGGKRILIVFAQENDRQTPDR